MLSKEQGIVAIGICAAYDIFLHWGTFWEGLLHLVRSSKPKQPLPQPQGAGEAEGDTGEVLLKGGGGGGPLRNMVLEEERKTLNGCVRDACCGKGVTKKSPALENGSAVRLTRRLGVLKLMVI